jgi:lysozyme family protein
MSSMFTSLLPFLAALKRQNMPSPQDEDGSNPPADQLDGSFTAARSGDPTAPTPAQAKPAWSGDPGAGAALAPSQGNPASTAQQRQPQDNQLSDTKGQQLIQLLQSGLQGSNQSQLRTTLDQLTRPENPPPLGVSPDGSLVRDMGYLQHAPSRISGPEVTPNLSISDPNQTRATLDQLVRVGAQDIEPPVMALADGSPYLASVKPTRPIHPVTMSDFGQAINNVIDVHEGGFQNRKDDPGNYTPSGELKGTKYGISAQSYPNEDIKNLTKQRAGELYQQSYGMFSALADQRVMTKALDLAVNMQNGGHGPATEILQKAINDAGGHVPVDGKFGTATADAANAIDPDRLLNAVSNQAAAHYKEIEAKRPDMADWFDNWDHRAQWQPPQTSSRVSNAATPWDADSAIANSERSGGIRSIRNALAGLSDQPARPVSAPQKKTGAPQKKAGGN